MMDDRPSFYGKLLLFGEYGIILDSMALTVPLREFSGRLRFAEPRDTENVLFRESNANLQLFLNYLKSHRELNQTAAMDYDRFSADLKDGLFFDSNIPQGYGAGSSGALVAAVYAEYSASEPDPSAVQNIPALKRIFSLMESYFHGTSSGLDPLSCFSGAPLLVNQGEEVRKVNIPLPGDGVSFFLIDTGITGSTGPLVKGFLEQLEEVSFNRQIREKFIPLTHQCIESLLTGEIRVLKEKFRELSLFQMEYFRKMIPGDFLKSWERGLSTDSYALKLCGSGGGGFILGMTRESGLPEQREVFLKGRIQYPQII